ncbi:SpoIIE family protein phosphatase [Thalassoglobus sp.]|uniref:SpoIIE family protein phosphatase n=1 Tax=Thalassoglobus sp. TaxID=2795869 RepID=UPI003AA84F0E
MAVLQLISDGKEKTQYVLEGEQIVLGRHPNCEIVLQSGVVSRRHAQILVSHGTYYLEDLRSRNGTYVNEQVISGRHELQEGDQLRLCDVVLTFAFTPSALITATNRVGADGVGKTLEVSNSEILNLSSSVEESRMYLPQEVEAEESFDSSTSIRKVASFNNEESLVDPSVKLRAILEITQAIGRELKVEKVLPKMLSTLFNIFPQAEQGFVLLRDNELSKLKVKASRARGQQTVDNVAVSMTVVRHAMQTREAILSKNVSDDSRFKKSTALSRMQIRSIMCVPMVTPEDEGIGVIQIVTRDEQQAFSEEDLDLLVSLASQASLAVANARLHEEDLVRREIERDMEFATQVQLGFLPKSRPKVDGYTFSDFYEAALSVGGDYFDYIKLPDGRLAMAIGDVAGKGIPAALLMARLYSSTRFQLLTCPTVADAVSGLNEEISSSGLGHRFITFLIMVINPETHTMEIVNAGHLTPLVRSADGSVKAVGKDDSNLPLGIVPDLKYTSSTRSIAVGETLIAFTDGVTEAMNKKKEIFGTKRLEELFKTLPEEIQLVIDGVVNASEAFADGMNARDDTCLIGVHRAAQ